MAHGYALFAYEEQDERFCAAVLAAVKAGLEQVPMKCVDKRPGTKNPRMLSAAVIANLRSPMGD